MVASLKSASGGLNLPFYSRNVKRRHPLLIVQRELKEVQIHSITSSARASTAGGAVTAAQAILKNLDGDFVAWRSSSSD
jgi:hypothetical protein